MYSTPCIEQVFKIEFFSEIQFDSMELLMNVVNLVFIPNGKMQLIPQSPLSD